MQLQQLQQVKVQQHLEALPKPRWTQAQHRAALAATSQVQLKQISTTASNALKGFGQVNFAAIEQFAKLQERKEKLAQEVHEITASMTTLEQAIALIDQQTKQA